MPFIIIFIPLAIFMSDKIDSLSLGDVVKLLVDFRFATGKSFWKPEDAERLKTIDPSMYELPQYKDKQFRKVIFFDRQAGLDAMHIEVGDLPRPHSAATGDRGLVEVTAQEFKNMFTRGRHKFITHFY